MSRKLILASASPRRRELLARLGLDFVVRPSGLVEGFGREPWGRQVGRLALAKARAVADELGEELVLGADTLVVVDGKALGKPVDDEEAYAFLELLSGRSHSVFSGVALVEAGSKRFAVDFEETLVYFRSLEAAEIRTYVLSGESRDKAGAYGIQELGSALVERIEGCYFNVVGLPLARLIPMLRGFGIKVLGI